MAENIYSIDFKVKILTAESIGNSYKVFGPVRRFSEPLCKWFSQFALENNFHDFEITVDSDLMFHCTFKDIRDEKEVEPCIKNLLNLEHQDLRTVLIGDSLDNKLIIKEYIVFCMPEGITIKSPLSLVRVTPSSLLPDAH